MKKLMIALGVLAMLSTKAQISFLEASQHTISPNSMGVVNGFQWNDTTYLALYDAYYGLGTRTMHIIEYDEFGKRRKEITPNYHYGGAIPKKLSKIGDSKIYLIGSGDDSLGRFTTFNYMYDENWNVLWSKGYDSRYGEIEILNDSVGIAPVFFRNYRRGIGAIDLNTGDTIWTKSYQSVLGLHDSVIKDYNISNIVHYDTTIYSLFINSNGDSNLLTSLDFKGTLSLKTVTPPKFNILLISNSELLTYRVRYDILPEIPFEFYSISNNTFNRINFSTNNLTQRVSNGGLIKVNNGFIIAFKERFVDFKNNNWISSLYKFNTRFEKIGFVCYSINMNEMDFMSIQSYHDKCFFITGYSNFLSPENNSFIMKTDSNGFVSNPTLFPLVVDTSLSVLTENIEKHDSQIKIYPNPASHQLTIELGSSQTAHYSIQILNGQEVQSGSFEQTTNLDLSKQPNGMYFLHLQGDSILETRKIVVQR